MKKNVKKMIKKAFSESTANAISLQAIIHTSQGVLTGGVPIHERYPPSIVLKPQKKWPFLKPMRGSKYYEELQESRRQNR